MIGGHPISASVLFLVPAANTSTWLISLCRYQTAAVVRLMLCSDPCGELDSWCDRIFLSLVRDGECEARGWSMQPRVTLMKPGFCS
jgi:hypothetical protein